MAHNQAAKKISSDHRASTRTKYDCLYILAYNIILSLHGALEHSKTTHDTIIHSPISFTCYSTLSEQSTTNFFFSLVFFVAFFFFFCVTTKVYATHGDAKSSSTQVCVCLNTYVPPPYSSTRHLDSVINL